MAQSTTIRLLSGDYPDRLQALFSAAQAAEKDNTPLLNGEEHPYEVLSAEYAALKAEAEAAGVAVTLTAVGRKGWRQLKGAHPPRTEGDSDTIKSDRLAGVNVETVEDDLTHASVTAPERVACAGDQRMPLVACSTENPCANRAAYDEWADELSEGEFQTILQKAWSLANVAQHDPKSLPASRTRTSGESTR